MIFIVIPHIVSSAFVYCDAVAAVEWKSAAACLGIDAAAGRDGAVDGAGVGDRAAAERATEAVAMDKRDRTRSRGYVEPVGIA
jgi:hypothetical protein